jgi:hypothetical protein
MATVYKYRVRCIEDSEWHEVWSETEPTACPHNTAHTLDPTLTSIVDKVEPTLIDVKEEAVPTGGHFQVTSIALTANANSIGAQKIYWPFNVTALQVNFVTCEENEGDIVNMYGGKNTITGVILAPISPASAWENRNYVVGEKALYTHAYHTGPRVYTCVANTVANNLPVVLTIPNIPANAPYWRHGYETPVSSTVITNTAIGYEHSITNGVTVTDMGRVISIDSISNKLYLEKNPDNSYSPGAYVRQTICFIKDYVLSRSWERAIGSSKIGGASIPPNVYVTAEYTNNSLTGNAKTLYGHCEILY